MNRLTDVGAEDREAKLYCAAGFGSGGVPAPERTPCATERTEGTESGAPVRSAGFSLSEKRGLAPARPYPPVPVPCFSSVQSTGFSLRDDNCSTTEDTEYSETIRGGAPVRSAGFSPSACNPQSAIRNPQSEESAIPGEAIVDYPQSGESAIRGEAIADYPQSAKSAIRGEAIADYPQSAIEECRGGSDWLDERATEALLHRAGVLCLNPQYPVYEKQTFAYDGWRVIQEHKKAAYGTGINRGTPYQSGDTILIS